MCFKAKASIVESLGPLLRQPLLRHLCWLTPSSPSHWTSTLTLVRHRYLNFSFVRHWCLTYIIYLLFTIDVLISLFVHHRRLNFSFVHSSEMRFCKPQLTQRTIAFNAAHKPNSHHLKTLWRYFWFTCVCLSNLLKLKIMASADEGLWYKILIILGSELDEAMRGCKLN
jgi:uncharacterized membrane protein